MPSADVGAAGALQLVLFAREVKPESTRVTPDAELEDELDKEDELVETLELDKEELDKEDEKLELKRELELELDEDLELDIELERLELELENVIEEDTEDEITRFELIELAALEFTEFTLEESELEPPPEPPQAESANVQTK